MAKTYQLTFDRFVRFVFCVFVDFVKRQQSERRRVSYTFSTHVRNNGYSVIHVVGRLDSAFSSPVALLCVTLLARPVGAMTHPDASG